jgi:Zn finger protein HypA/HybF involved in hydrogenase expression
MANTIGLRADCPACGAVEVAIDNAALVLGFAQQTPGHVLRYTCPRCHRERIDAVSERATRLLMAAGVGLVGSAADAAISPEGPGTRSSS